MVKFVRWLRALAHWMRSAPVKTHYWWALAVVVFFVAMAGVLGWSEKAFRLLGMGLQLGGVLTVVWGILKTRADFGQPTVGSQFGLWFKAFPQWNPPPIVLSVNPIELGVFGGGHLICTSGPAANQTVEGRLGHLESIVKKLEEAHGKMHIAVLEAEKKAQQSLDAQARQLVGQIDDVSKKIEATATGGVHVSAVGVFLLFFGTVFGSAAPELSHLLMPYQLLPLWRGFSMPSDLNKYLAEYLAPASAALAALVAYVAVYRNSQPQLVAYYQPSKRTQSIIELVIENVGTGNAYDIKFSKPIPISWFGIETPSGDGRYIPTSGIPSLAPGQRLVFFGGQYRGLLKVLGDAGMPLEISYRFHPPLWRETSATDKCVLSVKHLEGMASVKSLEQAVVDAIEGTNATTIKDIRGSLQEIKKHLEAISRAKASDGGPEKSDSND